MFHLVMKHVIASNKGFLHLIRRPLGVLWLKFFSSSQKDELTKEFFKASFRQLYMESTSSHNLTLSLIRVNIRMAILRS